MSEKYIMALRVGPIHGPPKCHVSNDGITFKRLFVEMYFMIKACLKLDKHAS